MFERTLVKNLFRIGQYFPILLLTGPRQVGKTTILEMISRGKMNYVSLDDISERALAQTDPALFIENHRPPVIIDEVQYAPELFSAIKIYVDSHKNENGLFWLTGSQKFTLMKNVQESLAGRVAVLDVLGLSAAEIDGLPETQPFLPTDEWLQNARTKPANMPSVPDLYTQIWNGSFPRLISQHNAERDIFYRSYMQTYIERDVRDSHNIEDSIAFYNFVKATAARTGQVLNYAELARDVGIDPKTAKSWMSVLERSGLVKLLQPYYNNVTNRIIKTPKIYFLDTGLCAYLTGWDSPKSLEAGAMSGAILETYVFIEILKSYWHNGKEALIYYYRDKDQKEIDFLIEANNRLYPAEVKKSINPPTEIIRQFNVLQNLNKEIGNCVILCLRPEILSLSKKVTLIPISAI